MEHKLLIGKHRRPRWPRKTSSLVRMINAQRDSIKPYSQHLYQHTSSQSTIKQMTVQTVDVLRSNFSSYSLFEFIAVTIYTLHDSLTRWALALLYTPFDFTANIAHNLRHAVLNLPPFVTWVLVPIAACYLLSQAIKTAQREYQTFLDLGRGGTPSTPYGLCKVSLLKFLANVDVLEPPHVDPMLEPYRGRLFNLRPRVGERPTVKGVAPQRQFDQKTPVDTFDKLLQLFKDTAENDENLKVTTSYLEGHTDALKGVFPDCQREVCGTHSEWDFEIAHPHRVDGSIHMILHPEDVKTVIENGWGERHPLATDAMWWRFIFHQVLGSRRPVPYNLVLIYAPRNKYEYKVVKQILEAAIWFHKERNICEKINQGHLVRTADSTILTREEALQSGQWVDAPDGKLMLLDRALDRGLYTWSSCGTKLLPNFEVRACKQC